VKDWQPTLVLGMILSRWSAVLLLGSGYGDTTQVRHSMPQEAARADSSYSCVSPPTVVVGSNVMRK
jgi:hypothetical protein